MIRNADLVAAKRRQNEKRSNETIKRIELTGSFPRDDKLAKRDSAIPSRRYRESETCLKGSIIFIEAVA